MQFMAYEMCDLCTVKHLLALPCSTTQMARAHIWPAGQPVQSSEVMATGTRSICNILTQVPYVQVEVFGAQGMPQFVYCLVFHIPECPPTAHDRTTDSVVQKMQKVECLPKKTLYSAEKCQLVLAEVAKVLMEGVA